MSSHRGKLLRLPPNRVWRTYPGGRTLDVLAGAAAPADTHFAEDWIASTTRALNPPQAALSALRPQLSALSSGLSAPPGISQVCVGLDDTPRDFAALLASDPEYFLGAAHVTKFGAQPQLLVKFLDSGTRLHLQVHPTREFAQRFLGAPSGKTEAYHVLAVREDATSSPAGTVGASLLATSGDTVASKLAPTPNPSFPSPLAPRSATAATGHIYVGFQRPPTPAQLRDYIATQNIAAIEACFDPIAVHPGDTFIIPGGTPHALGAGVFMVEIQEPSDLVVRFEFERAGYVLPEAARFMGRDLDFALTVFDLTPLTAADLAVRVRCTPRRRRALGPSSYQDELIGPNQTDCFRVLKSSLDSVVVKDETSAVVAIVTAGAVTAEVGGEMHRLRTYDKVFLPAGLGPVRYTPEPHAELLECLPPTA